MTKKILNEGLGVRQPKVSPTGKTGVGAGVGPRQPVIKPSAPKPGK